MKKSKRSTFILQNEILLYLIKSGIFWIVIIQAGEKGMMLINQNKTEIIFLFALLLLMVAITPMVSAAETTGNDGVIARGNGIIVVNIIFPKEGDVLYIDAIPPHLTTRVLGEIDALNGIQNISIRTGDNLTKCNFDNTQHSSLQCEVPSHFGKNQIIINIVDNRGNIFDISRNYSIYIGQMPPSTTSLMKTLLPQITSQPQKTPQSGFNLPLGIFALIIGLIMLNVKRS